MVYDRTQVFILGSAVKISRESGHRNKSRSSKFSTNLKEMQWESVIRPRLIQSRPVEHSCVIRWKLLNKGRRQGQWRGDISIILCSSFYQLCTKNVQVRNIYPTLFKGAFHRYLTKSPVYTSQTDIMASEKQNLFGFDDYTFFFSRVTTGLHLPGNYNKTDHWFALWEM